MRAEALNASGAGTFVSLFMLPLVVCARCYRTVVVRVCLPLLLLATCVPAGGGGGRRQLAAAAAAHRHRHRHTSIEPSSAVNVWIIDCTRGLFTRRQKVWL